MLLRSLRRRDLRPEIMDEPDLAAPRHREALDGLARVNWLSGGSSLVWRPIRDLARRIGGNELTVLDVGSGAGDVACRLWRRARAAGLKLRTIGYDVSPCAVETAQKRASALGADDVRFLVRNAFEDAWDGPFDVVMCSLFLHHWDEAHAVELLRRMKAATRRLAVVNDLRRCYAGYWAAHAVVRLATSSDVVHYDGPQSVAAAFSCSEVRGLADAAGLADARIERTWPFRFLLTWEPAK